jgi:hypothetical protein
MERIRFIFISSWFTTISSIHEEINGSLIVTKDNTPDLISSKVTVLGVLF